MGCQNPEVLRNLGRDQASFMIDAFIRDKDEAIQFELGKRAAQRSAENKKVVIQALLIVAAIAILGAVVHYMLIK